MYFSIEKNGIEQGFEQFKTREGATEFLQELQSEGQCLDCEIVER